MVSAEPDNLEKTLRAPLLPPYSISYLLSPHSYLSKDLA